MSDAKLILGIHGLNNKPSRRVLSDWWVKSIQEGFQNQRKEHVAELPFLLVYWADLLYKYQTHRDPNFVFDELYNLQPYTPAPSQTNLRKRDRFAVKIKGLVAEFLGDNFERFGDSDQLVKLAGWAVGKMARDLDYYDDSEVVILGRNGQKASAQEVLRTELREQLLANRNREILLLAHSMGSIIALDVLYELGKTHPDFRLHTLISMGAPLGLPNVRARMRDEWGLKRLRSPQAITHQWINLFDPGDAISMDIELRKLFAKNKQGVKVEDIRMVNDYIAPDQSLNKHKIYGYLRSEPLIERLEEFLKSD